MQCYIAETILSLKQAIHKAYEEKRLIEAEISRVKPLGDFSMEDIEDIERRAHRKIQFFCMKTAKRHKTNFTDEVIYLNTDYDLDYFLTINPEATNYPGMIEMRIDRPLGELEKQHAIVVQALEKAETELKDYAGHIDYLREALVIKLNDYNLIAAKKEASFPLEHALFSIEAWVPKNKVPLLYSFIDGMAVHAEEILIDKDERIPTYLENKGVRRIGEDLILIYDVPAPTDKDPSGWVMYAFLFFFAMIIADAGYGFLYLLLALFIKWKMPNLKGMGRRMYRLLFLLACSCIAWGVVTSSYFGLSIGPENPLTKFSIITYLAEKKAEYHFEEKDSVYESWAERFPDLKNAHDGKEIVQNAYEEKNGKIEHKMYDEFSDNILLELALLVGVIHISLSLARNVLRSPANIGWIIFAFGGYFFFPSILQATSMVNFLHILSKLTATTVGLQMIYVGVILAVVIALIHKRLQGLFEVTHVMQVFADILSYLRLYALALASTILAETFNEMAGTIGFAIGILIIIVGHGINISLASGSAVIHGLRLNVIEWYHYSFEGGGRLFTPLKKLKAK